jgi:hypothetical protein
MGSPSRGICGDFAFRLILASTYTTPSYPKAENTPAYFVSKSSSIYPASVYNIGIYTRTFNHPFRRYASSWEISCDGNNQRYNDIKSHRLITDQPERFELMRMRDRGRNSTRLPNASFETLSPKRKYCWGSRATVRDRLIFRQNLKNQG